MASIVKSYLDAVDRAAEDKPQVPEREFDWGPSPKRQDAPEIVPVRENIRTTQAPGFWKIALAVFVGNMLAAIVVSIIYGVSR